MLIKTRNILTESASRTYLTNAEVAGTTIFRIKNGNGFANSWAIQLGETGEEQSEVLVLSGAPSGTAGTTTAASVYEHPTDTPVYATKYNQVVFERSTAGTAGTATPMTSGTITVQADQEYTQFDDTTGSASYAYRTYFRSSGLAANSTESDWITSAGFSFYSLAALRERAKEKLWKAEFVTDTMQNNWINEWKDEMSNAVISLNQDYAMGTVDVAFSGTTGLGTIATADFKQPKRVEVTHSGTQFRLSTKMDSNNYLPDQTFSSANPHHNWEGDSVFRVHPADQGGTARFTFYRFGTTMVNDTDDLPQPFRSYTKSFVNYQESQALGKDGKIQEAKDKLSEAFISKSEFVSQMTPRDKSGPTYIEVVESTTGEDNWIP